MPPTVSLHRRSLSATLTLTTCLSPLAAALAQTSPPVAAVAAAPAASASKPADDSQPQALQTIQVTSQRVKQKLQDVPAAVTAFNSEAIDQLQIQSAGDLSRLVPNAKFDAGTGGSTSLKPFIRGGGVTDGGQVTSESAVGVYLDDVYQARLSAALVSFVELERLEVLRGPQGVLYGRNSSAGALNILTRAPSEIFTASGEVGVGNWGERRIKGYVSGPLTDDKRWRGSFQGMVRGRDNDGQYNVTLNKKVGQEDFQGFQGDLAYDDGDLKGRLTAYYTHTDGDGQWATPTTVDSSGKIKPTAGSYNKVASPDPSLTNVEQFGSTLHLSKDVGAVRLTSISGYSKLDDHWREDFSGGVSALLAGGTTDTTVALYERDSRTHQHQFSEELQAAGDAFGGFVNYVGGLYYFSESGTQDMTTTTYFVPSIGQFDIDTTSLAAFGQASLHLTPQDTLQLGGRYSHDDKHIEGNFDGDDFKEHNTYGRFTPKISLDHKLTANTLVYASYSEGFKAGGYNGLATTVAQITQPFKPEYTKAIELGVKSELFNRSLRVNAAVFHNKIENRQQTLTVTSGADAGSFVVENYNAKLNGLELEFAWRVTSGLSLWGNAALNDGKYVSCSSAADADCSVIDNKLPMLPKYVFTVGVDETLPIGEDTLRFGADYNVRDHYFSTADNVAIGAVPRQEFLNGYVAYDMGPWTFQLAGKNLLNQHGWQTGFGFSAVQPRFAIPGRTILLTARYQY